MIYSNAYKLQITGLKSPSVLGVYEVHNLVSDDGPEGKAIWAKAIADAMMKDDGRDPATVLVDLMQYGNEGADFCAKRGLSILADALKGALQHDDDARKQAETTLAELGGWAVGRTVRDTCAAYRFATAGTAVELTPEIEKRFAGQNTQFMHDRKLTDDQLFAPIIRPLQANQPVQVGVLLEPDWRMNDAFLGYTDRIITAAACRTLANANRSYATIDVRDVLTGSAPDPKEVPTLLISASALRDYGWMHVADLSAKLEAYLKAGGGIIWIGGESLPSEALGPIRSGATRIEKQTVPIKELMKDDDALHNTKLVLLAGEEASWNFVRPPVLNIGWTQPLCPWKFENLASELTPLLRLQSGDESTTVGVLWTPATGKTVQAAFIPIYAVAPKILVKDGVLQHPTEPEFDEPGATILLRTIDKLQ